MTKRGSSGGGSNRSSGTPNRVLVQPAPQGGWNNNRPGAARASSHHATQAEAITRARELVANSGGGELTVCGENGQIRASDTISPGNDPRSSKG